MSGKKSLFASIAKHINDAHQSQSGGDDVVLEFGFKRQAETSSDKNNPAPSGILA
jgi:anthranilate phosphoribosyltransferase